MKWIPPYLLMLVPVFLFSQSDDYCPCMEEEFGDYFTQVFVEEKKELPKKELPVEKEPMDETPVEEDASKVKKFSKKKMKAQRAGLKKSKHRFFVPLKKRKKPKRYRGQCPMF